MLFSRFISGITPRDIPFVTAAIALTAFVSSFLVALLMVIDGQPAFLAIWSILAGATMIYVRAHRKWRGAFKRIYPKPASSGSPTQSITSTLRKNWRNDVQDVTFREVTR